MRDFFKGWRRKTGCVTLVVALVAMAGWVRSRSYSEEMLYRHENGYYALQTQLHGVAWTSFVTDPTPTTLPKWEYGRCDPFTNDSFSRTNVFVWRIQRFGFDFGQRRLKNYPATTTTFWTLPYWFLILPFTLLSAYLNIWKPRQRTGPDHAPDDGIRSHC